ncbi:MAG: GntR family transcriptional regulator [Sphingomonadales bacterium]|nr:GntR family transcriptional regulator [Sphingomonadales bacterium]MDE2169398.1 GntR family transcriptional regulator [Sphingomonadales bacterium]
MAPEPVAAERAYQRLKSDLVSGRYRPGTVLVERVIAQEFGVSVSPVRDGAQRLVGEGLLEVASGGGYRIPMMTHIMLRDLYTWHSHLLRLVVKSDLDIVPAFQSDAQALSDDPAAIARLTTELFRTLARQSRNGEYTRALLAANDRLHPVRLREGHVLANLTSELLAVMTSTIFGSGPDRLAGILAYHRRRLRRVNKIVEVL